MVTSVATRSLAQPAGAAGESLVRVLLASDGTLTTLLEALAGEPITIELLVQRERDAHEVHESAQLLGVGDHEQVIERAVLLVGERSRRAFVHARSVIAAGRLGPCFRAGLVRGDCPIGRLWRELRVETWKEVLGAGRRLAGSLGTLLDVDPELSLPMRTCRVFADGLPMMLVDEVFADRLAERFGWR